MLEVHRPVKGLCVGDFVRVRKPFNAQHLHKYGSPIAVTKMITPYTYRLQDGSIRNQRQLIKAFPLEKKTTRVTSEINDFVQDDGSGPINRVQGDVLRRSRRVKKPCARYDDYI